MGLFLAISAQISYNATFTIITIGLVENIMPAVKEASNQSYYETHPETGGIPVELQAMLERITPERLNARLDELSGIFSTRSEYGPDAHLGDDFPERRIGEGGSREAFTEADFKARDLVESWMEGILREKYKDAYTDPTESITKTARIRTYMGGITVEQNAAGVIVTYAPEGTARSKPAIAFGSHIDTVKRAGRYDGQGGIAAGICVLETLIESDAIPGVPMKFVVVTGEESGKVAFSGSQILARGLNVDQLDTTIEMGVSLRKGLTKWAEYFHIANFDPASLNKPLINENALACHLEVHPHPTMEMVEAKIAVAPAEKLMGARRKELVLRAPPLLAEAPQSAETSPWGREKIIFELSFEGDGKSSHVGAIEMQNVDRTDVFVQLGLAFPDWLETTGNWCNEYGVYLDVSDVTISGQALNKVPQTVRVEIVIHGNDYDKVLQAANLIFGIESLILLPFAYTSTSNGKIYFKKNGYSSEDQERYLKLKKKIPYPKEALNAALHIAFMTSCLARAIETAALAKEERFTATCSTMKKEGNVICLGIDVIATDPFFLTILSSLIYRNADVIAQKRGLLHAWTDLSGSVDPVMLNTDLIRLIQISTARLQGKSPEEVPTFVIPAGEDASILNKLCPCGMIFVASNGICHKPEEHVDPQTLLLGARTLLACVYQLGKHPLEQHISSAGAVRNGLTIDDVCRKINYLEHIVVYNRNIMEMLGYGERQEE